MISKKIILSSLIFISIFVSCSESDPLPEKSYKEDISEEINENYSLKKNFDAESSTYYYLVTINHKDSGGNILQLEHSHANSDLGETVYNFAKRMNNPLVALNASTMYSSDEGKVNATGIQIIEDEILQDRTTTAYTLGVKDNNLLVSYPPGITAEEVLADGSHNALSAFIPLIIDHAQVDQSVLSIRDMFKEKHPRQVIAQYNNLDLLVMSCGGRGYDGQGMTVSDLIRVLSALDVKFAFMLDGGGSVSTVVNGEQITKKIDNNGTEDRPRPNFLYVH